MSIRTFYQPELLVLGHITRDHIGQDVRLGGAASFAAQAAAGMRVTTGIVTSAPADFDLITPLTTNPHIQIVRTPSDCATEFELDYSGPVRRVRMLARAADIQSCDVPLEFNRAAVAYVAPVCRECGYELIKSLKSKCIVVGAQGWFRATLPDGTVVPDLAPEAAKLPPDLTAIIFSELDHPESEFLAQNYAKHVPIVALTRGALGATLYVDGVRHNLTAHPAQEIDPTGAGDVFGLVLGLAVNRGADPLEAAQLASAAAARVVEGPGIGRLAQFCDEPAWAKLGAA